MIDEMSISSYLYRKAAKTGIPLGCTFELTPMCNMSCRMCYVRMNAQQVKRAGGLKDAEWWITLAEKAKAAGTVYILITGGEPFTHPQFREIYTALSKMGFIISINTNGTLIDDRAVGWLREIPPARFNITLYGASEETYENLCGDGSFYNKAVGAIDRILAAGMQIRLNASFTKLNVRDKEEIYEFAKKRNLPVATGSYMFPPARRLLKDGEEFPRLDACDAGRLIFEKELRSSGDEAALRRAKGLKETIDDDVLPVGLGGKPRNVCSDEGDATKCRAGRVTFWVSYNGK
ncbi:MAG TPA: radical SAM protein, partial [Bacillota bacterium]|nr:radical SAM protein [Bacillota bacterium]